MGIIPEAAHTAARIGFNKWTTVEQIDQAFEIIKEEVQRLRSVSIVWDQMMETDENSIIGSSIAAKNSKSGKDAQNNGVRADRGLIDQVSQW